MDTSRPSGLCRKKSSQPVSFVGPEGSRRTDCPVAARGVWATYSVAWLQPAQLKPAIYPSNHAWHERVRENPDPTIPAVLSSSYLDPAPNSRVVTMPLQPPLASARPASSRTFNLPSSSSSSDTEDDDPNALPFPTALPRSDFLTPDFDAAAYLSSLTQRHQTLEDLRSDLRERSAAISAELLELVNTNYTSFLSLGSELRGGEERVEDVRVGLLGFRRAVEEVKGRVGDRGREVGELNSELVGVRRNIEIARRMLELDDKLEALESRLAVNGAEPDSDDSEEEDEDNEEDNDAIGTSTAKLASLAKDCIAVEALADSIGRDTPVIKKMGDRMSKCRSTILLDLATALKEARRAGAAGQGKLLKLMGIYALMDAQQEAVRTLKSS